MGPPVDPPVKPGEEDDKTLCREAGVDETARLPVTLRESGGSML